MKCLQFVFLGLLVRSSLKTLPTIRYRSQSEAPRLLAAPVTGKRLAAEFFFDWIAFASTTRRYRLTVFCQSEPPRQCDPFARIAATARVFVDRRFPDNPVWLPEFR